MLKRKDLDKALIKGCEKCKDKRCNEKLDKVFLNARCHPRKGVDAAYLGGGRLMLRCHACEKEIATIEVQK
jgi:hypothetical protein